MTAIIEKEGDAITMLNMDFKNPHTTKTLKVKPQEP